MTTACEPYNATNGKAAQRQAPWIGYSMNAVPCPRFVQMISSATYILGVSEIGFGFFLRLMPGLGLRGAGAGATPDADMLDEPL